MLPICLETTSQRLPLHVLVLMGIWAREAVLEKRRREYPTIHLLHDLAHLLLGLFNAHELATLFLAILIEEAGIPIPHTW